MLEAVGHPVAVNPDRELRRLATQEKWPVRDFERPVALRAPWQVLEVSALDSSARGPILFSTLALLAVAATTAFLAARRR